MNAMKSLARMKLLACALLALGLPTIQACTSSGEHAFEYGQWKSSQMWGGGYVQDVVPCPSDPKRFYAYIDMAGFYRSDDGGNTWRMMHGSLKGSERDIRGLIVDPRNADKIIFAAGRPLEPAGIFASDDGGKTYSLVQKATFAGNNKFRSAGFLLARDPANPDRVLAASIGDGLWESRDNGKSWECLGLKDLWPSELRFDSADPKRLWLCAQSWEGTLKGKKSKLDASFFRSDDGGKTWTKLSDESPTEILPIPYEPGSILGIFGERIVKKSLDAGATWSDFSEGLPIAESLKSDDYCNPHRFNAMAAGPDFLLAANVNGDFYRLDKGQTKWSPIPCLGIDANGWWANLDPKNGWSYFGKALGTIRIDPKDPSHWYFTDWFAVYQTFDSGSHWKATIDGMAQTVVHCLSADPANAGTMHLGMADNGYFRSTDGGKSFKHDAKGIGCNVKCIAPSPSEPNLVYAAGANSWKCNTVYVSRDDGMSWQAAACKGLPDKETHFIHSIAVDPKSSKRLFAAVTGSPEKGEGGVYESSDGGESWSWKGDGLQEGKGFFHHDIWTVGRELSVSSDGSMVCASHDRKMLYFWDDASGSWTKVALPPDAAPLDIMADPFVPGRFAIGALKVGVLISEDGGRSWKKTLDASAGQVGFDLKVKGRLAASTDNGVALSRDGGASWEILDRELPDRRHKNSPAFSGDRLVVGSSASGAFWTEIGKGR